MKPNEISQRDIDKWTRSAAIGQPCRPLKEAAESPCDSAYIADARKLFETIAAKSRLADLGEQTSALAHELRQPLFSIAVANENLRLLLGQANIAQPQLTGAIARIAEQVGRAQTIIDRTLAYASGHGAGAVQADIGVAASNAVQFLKPLFDAADIEIDDRLARTHASIALCQVETEQVFVNILRNAAESIEARRESGWKGSGRIAIHVSVVSGMVCCAVADNGAGLSRETARSVFDPFFTTKPRTGTGLGLHICRQILGQVGGIVTLVPNQDNGARVEIEIPVIAAE
jgi:two-component system C4-dicarboxylate transport sensor histidine kinase DctB/two-component system sensor histidine kinase TtrS